MIGNGLFSNPYNSRNHIKTILQVPDSDTIQTQLQQHFGYADFRPGQREAIEAVLAGKDTLLLLPTGGGKSLCYQLPALTYADGVVLVISPLISLMKDQAQALENLNIPAAVYNSSIDELEQMKALSHAVTGKIRVLFLSPERAVNSYFLAQVVKMSVRLLVVDEAHCISRWGHDFRPEYTKLSLLQEKLPTQTATLALTATATVKVRSEIEKYLGLNQPQLIQRSFLRPNLHFAVHFFESETTKKQHLLKELSEFAIGQKAIIYCSTRRMVEELAQFLKPLGARVGYYHAGKPESFRERAQNQFISGKKSILIATNAFGLGIDLPNIRLVVHFQTPGSLEAYYQEAGRAGRDGSKARCLLFYRDADLTIQKRFSSGARHLKNQRSLWEFMRDYAYANECRQQTLCGYFTETIEACGCCDVCTGSHNSEQAIEKLYQQEQKQKKQLAYEFSEEEEEYILQFIRKFPGKYGKTVVTGVLKGSMAKDILKFRLNEHVLHGRLAAVPTPALKQKLESLVASGKLVIKGKKYPKLSVPFAKKTAVRSPSNLPTQIRKNSDRNRLLRELRNFRDREARRKNQKKYMILSNQVLSQLASNRPKTNEQLLAIKGMGNIKTGLYGEELLKIIASFEIE